MDGYFIDKEQELKEGLMKKTPKEIADFLGIEFNKGVEGAIRQFKCKIIEIFSK